MNAEMISIERARKDRALWSRVSVALLKRTPEERFTILERFGLDPHDWDEVDALWTRALAHEILSGDTSAAEAYGRACRAELLARKAGPAVATDEEGTLPIGDLGSGGTPALPFVRAAAQATSFERSSGALPGQGSDGETVEVMRPSAPVTPFR